NGFESSNWISSSSRLLRFSMGCVLLGRRIEKEESSGFFWDGGEISIGIQPQRKGRTERSFIQKDRDDGFSYYVDQEGRKKKTEDSQAHRGSSLFGGKFIPTSSYYLLEAERISTKKERMLSEKYFKKLPAQDAFCHNAIEGSTGRELFEMIGDGCILRNR